MRSRLRFKTVIFAFVSTGIIATSATLLADEPVAFNANDFDSLLKSWGGVPPYPPEKILEAILQNSKNALIDAAVIPHGRSLERGVTDTDAPRTIFTWGLNKSSNTPDGFLPAIKEASQTYIAYTPNKSQLEIIKYNPTTNESKFYLVENYGPGKKPQMQEADKAVCQTCHQNGLSVFSIFPWSETQANPAVLKALSSSTHLDSFAKYVMTHGLVTSDKAPTPSEALKNIRVSSSLLSFDANSTALIKQAHQICESLCSDDVKCKKDIIQSALTSSLKENDLSPLLPSPTMIAQYPELRDTVTKSWPKDNFSSINSFFIPNRTPQPGSEATFSTTEDPLRPRPHVFGPSSAGIDTEVGILISQLPNCIFFSDSQKKILGKLSGDKGAEFMKSDELTKLISKKGIPSANEVLKSMTIALKSDPISCELTNAISLSIDSAATAVEPITTRILNLPTDNPKKLFGVFCAECHSDGGSGIPILPLNDFGQLKTYIGKANADRTVLKVLSESNVIMPPHDYIQPSSQDRKAMIEAVESGQ